jgi:hypothetical protein
MQVVIGQQEQRWLVDLLDGRIRELYSEIRRCKEHAYQDELKEERHALEALLGRLRQSECDAVT